MALPRLTARAICFSGAKKNLLLSCAQQGAQSPKTETWQCHVSTPVVCGTRQRFGERENAGTTWLQSRTCGTARSSPPFQRRVSGKQSLSPASRDGWPNAGFQSRHMAQHEKADREFAPAPAGAKQVSPVRARPPRVSRGGLAKGWVGVKKEMPSSLPKARAYLLNQARVFALPLDAARGAKEQGLYQGTTLVVPIKCNKFKGFSPCHQTRRTKICSRTQGSFALRANLTFRVQTRSRFHGTKKLTLNLLQPRQGSKISFKG